MEIKAFPKIVPGTLEASLRFQLPHHNTMAVTNSQWQELDLPPHSTEQLDLTVEFTVVFQPPLENGPPRGFLPAFILILSCINAGQKGRV